MIAIYEDRSREIVTTDFCTQCVDVYFLHALQLRRVHQRETVCCDHGVISYMLNVSATRWAPSDAQTSTVYARLTTIAHDTTLARTATNRISLESVRSALQDDTTGYSLID